MLSTLQLVVKVKTKLLTGEHLPQATATSRGDPLPFFPFRSCDMYQASWRRLDFSFGIVRTICL